MVPLHVVQDLIDQAVRRSEDRMKAMVAEALTSCRGQMEDLRQAVNDAELLLPDLVAPQHVISPKEVEPTGDFANSSCGAAEEGRTTVLRAAPGTTGGPKDITSSGTAESSPTSDGHRSQGSVDSKVADIEAHTETLDRRTVVLRDMLLSYHRQAKVLADKVEAFDNFATDTGRRAPFAKRPEPTIDCLAKAVNSLYWDLNSEAAARKQLAVKTYGLALALARDNDRGELGRQDYAAITQELYRVADNAKNVDASERAARYAAWFEQRI